MKTSIILWVAGTATLLATVSAGESGEARGSEARAAYRITTLPSLGGTQSSGNGINDLEWVTGSSALAGNQTIRPTLWLDGRVTDLGTLGGANGSVVWPVKDTVGIITGISETTTVDPLGEQWSCSAFIPTTGTTCLGFVWEFGNRCG